MDISQCLLEALRLVYSCLSIVKVWSELRIYGRLVSRSATSLRVARG